MYRGTSGQARLARSVRDFEIGTRAFQVSLSGHNRNESRPQNKADKEMKLLICPSGRVDNVEAKINMHADQLANLTLIPKKNHDATDHGRPMAKHHVGASGAQTCSLCGNSGNGAN